jgi:hypothetical protein
MVDDEEEYYRQEKVKRVSKRKRNGPRYFCQVSAAKLQM